MPKASTSNPGIQRYALAFFHAIKGERMDPIMAEYRMILELFRAYPDLTQVLNHLLLKDEEKERILARVLETCSVSKEMASFLKTLLRRRHMDWLESIFEALQALVDKAHNRATAFVKVAVKLSEVQREKLRAKLEQLTHKKIDLRVEFDPTVIGGIVAKVGDRIFDTSLKNKLNLIKAGMES
ncbi:MAG: ATP synthase F1 subunit delta [Candidatus Omnitrophica bacterium]|nr:ATP synthase F1 subunit delta [Candidatus Omnitrophota bacterium]